MGVAVWAARVACRVAKAASSVVRVGWAAAVAREVAVARSAEGQSRRAACTGQRHGESERVATAVECRALEWAVARAAPRARAAAREARAAGRDRSSGRSAARSSSRWARPRCRRRHLCGESRSCRSRCVRGGGTAACTIRPKALEREQRDPDVDHCQSRPQTLGAHWPGQRTRSPRQERLSTARRRWLPGLRRLRRVVRPVPTRPASRA